MREGQSKIDLVDVLDVRIDNLDESEILKKIEGFLDEPKFHQIATVNPEFILEARKNSGFKNILNSCDLNVADGTGIRFAFLRNLKFLKCCFAGADLMMEVLRLADKKGSSVFLACRKDGLSSWEETGEAILKIYPNLRIEGCNFHVDEKYHTSIQPYMEVLDDGKVNAVSNKSGEDWISKCDIIFCNFGAPHQEIFMNSLKSRESAKIRLAMGVGGGFDFLTGKVRRAPKFLRFLGLEWLWRTFQPQPWKFKKQRLKRIFRAVVVFPIKVVLKK